MEEKPILSIIIINFNSAQYLKNCLLSIASQIIDFPSEIIIVNNDPREKLDFVQPPMILISNQENLGFGAGANLGARKAKGKILFFLNPDTFWRFGSLRQAANFLLTNNLIAILGAKLTDSSDKSEPENFGPPITPWNILLRKIFPARKNPTSPFKTGRVSGGAMFVKKDAFEKIGGFDENFFMYYEDSDICQRAINLGMNIYFYPKISFFHASGKSFVDTKKQKNFYYQSQKYYLKKHFGKKVADIMHVLRKFFVSDL